MASTHREPDPMTPEETRVILASSLGTVFEWYDFYLYGALAAIIARQFFSALDPGSAFLFALLAFAAGFIVRPFGALLFGRLGDLIGRKYTFLITMVVMGLAAQRLADAGFSTHIVIESGDVAQVLGRHLTIQQLPLLVMSAFTHNGWRQKLLGTTTSTLLRRIPTSVLVLR